MNEAAEQRICELELENLELKYEIPAIKDKLSQARVWREDFKADGDLEKLQKTETAIVRGEQRLESIKEKMKSNKDEIKRLKNGE
jgi:hypothetical protein